MSAAFSPSSRCFSASALGDQEGRISFSVKLVPCRLRRRRSMTRSSFSSTPSRPRAPAAALDGPLLVLEHLLQTSSSGGGGMGKTTRAWGRRRLAPAAHLAPRAGGLMMEDLHSWLHQRRRCRFCFCSPLAHSAKIGGGMEYCRGMDAASFGAGLHVKTFTLRSS
ncbi:uncharacterized protein [Triticum aestivum]|uniref:uncharacterized protein isoform X2 n=2 Tax=Triticum TaxID=4564 RepID=UPI001D0252B7|nr:uncharacterized protein LOC123061440 isoform X2 [Triticum aestivum]